MTMLHTFQQILPEPAKQVLAQHGWRRFLGLSFYPIILLITTPLRLMQTLWNCRVLADGKWEDYNRFAPHHALNSLVYRTFAINFSRFGRSGRSSYLGNGEYFLGRGWAYSLPSLYAYWRFGPIVPLAGMFGWWVAHILWVDLPGNLLWKGLVIMLTLVSTTCYANTFALQNYNALGWVFMPIGLYGWATGHWMLAMLSWFGASFGSFTVVFLACLLSLAESMHLRNFWPLLSVIPAGIKLLTHFWPLAGSGNIWRNLHDIAKALGLSRRNVKYVYTKGLRFNLSKLYYAGLYGQFLAIVWLAGNRIPVLLIAAILIWLINSRVARFADEQSMQMLVLSVATATMLPMPDPDALLFISFWLLASPLPLFAGFPGTPLLTVPVYAPFYLAPLVAEMEEFLAPVSKGQRVLVAFEDPQGIYENVFDGYRTLLELPLYVAARQEIHVMPDWWGVFELNYDGAPDFWGRDVEDVTRQMTAWNAEYVVIYQPAGSVLESNWEQAGFTMLRHFSWKRYEQAFSPGLPWSGPTPDWWLLEKSLMTCDDTRTE